MRSSQRVLIVRVGPAGLTLAPERTRIRVPVTITDQTARRTGTSRASVLWIRSLALFARAGYADKMISSGADVGVSFQ
jgi:2-polyprenyl-6-methoxyphenol hydroxylase-like FAD-dependent oxidoreductase